MAIDYVRRPRPAQQEQPTEPEPVVVPQSEAEPVDPSPVEEPTEDQRQLVGWRLASSITLGLTAPVLLWFGLPGWAWLAAGLALVLSRWFPGLIRFGLAYVGLKAIRAVVVFTASRRGELRGAGGRVCDPDAEWRRWLEA